MDITDYKQKVVKSLQEKFTGLCRDYIDHISRVDNTIEWLSKVIIQRMHIEGLGGSIIDYYGTKCLITQVDFTGSPLFRCEIIIKPCSSSDDVGNGCGMSRTLMF